MYYEKKEATYRIGARIHDILKDSSTLQTDLQKARVQVAQLTLPKFVDASCELTSNKLLELLGAFTLAGTNIRVLSCYINPLAEDLQVQQELFKRYIDYAVLMGVGIVATETGTIDSNLSNFEKNHTEEIFVRLINAMSPLVEYAEARGVCIGLESVVYFPVCNGTTFNRFKGSFHEKSICSIFDPTNLLYIGNYQNQREIFKGFVEMHATDIKIIHLKDFVVENNTLRECALFEGILDVDYVISLLKKYDVDADIIIEGAKSVDNYKEISSRLKRMLRRNEKQGKLKTIC